MRNDRLLRSVREIRDSVNSGNISASEITEKIFRRISETEDGINAFVTLTQEKAREMARLVDERIKKGEQLPLAGVPFSLKDNLAVDGVKMTCSSGILRDFVPPYSSDVYEKLKNAGAVLVGKTNMDEFAMGSSTERSYFGATHNPLDRECAPGGSSGGSAASVAAGMAAFSIGTDTGGSSRQPASFCGLVSMKPTYGLISRFGMAEFAPSLDTVCPITNNVIDNALVLSVIGGADGKDMTSHGTITDYTDFDGKGISGMKAAIAENIEYASDGVKAAFFRAVDTLRAMGVDVDTVPLCDLPDFESILETYLVIVSAECSSCLSRYDGIRFGSSGIGEDYRQLISDARKIFGDEVERRIIAGTYSLTQGLGGGYYSRIRSLRFHLAETADRLFNKYDFILTPTTSDSAFKLGERTGKPGSMYGSDIYTVFANVTGCPSVTIPCGGEGRLPYGILLTGGKKTEKKLYEAAFALEEKLSDLVEKEVCFL